MNWSWHLRTHFGFVEILLVVGGRFDDSDSCYLALIERFRIRNSWRLASIDYLVGFDAGNDTGAVSYCERKVCLFKIFRKCKANVYCITHGNYIGAIAYCDRLLFILNFNEIQI